MKLSVKELTSLISLYRDEPAKDAMSLAMEKHDRTARTIPVHIITTEKDGNAIYVDGDFNDVFHEMTAKELGLFVGGENVRFSLSFSRLPDSFDNFPDELVELENAE